MNAPYVGFELPHGQTGRTVDAREKKPKKRRRIRRALGAFSVFGALSYPPACVIEAIQFQLEPTKVTAYNSTPSQSDIANINDICFFTSGLGLDMSRSYADKSHPATDPYCRIATVLPSNIGIDFAEIARREMEFIDETTQPDKPVNIYYFGGSMGALVNLGTAKELERNDKKNRMTIRLQILDSSPTGPEDTKGWLEEQWVKNGPVFNCKIPLFGYKRQLVLGVEVLSRLRNGEFPNSREDFKDVSRVAGETEMRRYCSQLSTIETFKDDVNLNYYIDNATPVVLMFADNPDNDDTVDVDSIRASWEKLLPQTLEIPIKDGRHASSNFVDYGPAFVRAFRQAGALTIKEREDIWMQTIINARNRYLAKLAQYQ